MPIGISRLGRTQLVLSTLLLTLGLLAGISVTAGPAVARMPATTGIYFGGAGDDDALVSRTSEPLASHTYGYFESRPGNARMLTVKFKNFKSWSATAALTPSSTGYKQIATWADALKQRRGELLLAFHHEPESSSNRKYGTPAQYKSAYRKVISIFRARGATNVSFTWQMTSWSFRSAPSQYTNAAKWYPGDAYVDVVGTDPYNWYTCGHGNGRWLSLKSLVDPAITFARSHGKQVVVAEYGSHADSKRPAWIREAGKYLAANDKIIVAAFYFNRAPTNSANSDCKWRLTTTGDFAAYRDVARMSVMKH
jgi:hypothetical protein